ncbi:hypothetical protein RCL1_001846 [Eukaryota sp. TZLM3-RCL]
MVHDIRVTLRRRLSFNTASNATRIVKTPGGRLTVQYLKKKGTVPRCGDCGCDLHGIPALRPREYSRLAHNKKTVSRPYGGSVCHGCVKSRILRAFLSEEQKIVKQMKKDIETKDKKASKKRS